MPDIADRKVGTTDTVEVGQEWRSKRNGRVVKVVKIHFDEHNDVIGVDISDKGKRRPVTSNGRTIPGYEFLVQDWVDFGDVARDRIGMQSQYCSRYIDGRHGDVCLSEGLRFRGEGGKKLDVADYHFIEIHKDDVEEFVRRVMDYRRKVGAIIG